DIGTAGAGDPACAQPPETRRQTIRLRRYLADRRKLQRDRIRPAPPELQWRGRGRGQVVARRCRFLISPDMATFVRGAALWCEIRRRREFRPYRILRPDGGRMKRPHGAISLEMYRMP